MIGIKGQWVCTISDNLINPDELLFLAIDDDVSLNLPSLRMQVRTQDEKKMAQLVDISKSLEIGLGRDSIEERIKFRLLKKQVIEGEQGGSNYFITIWGIMEPLSYIKDLKIQSYETFSSMKKSSEVWKVVMERNGFAVETESSRDKMMWVQPNVSDRKFLEDISWNGFFGEGKPGLATVRRDKKAIYKSISSLKVKKGTIGNQEGSSIDWVADDYVLERNDGFLSFFGGYKRNTYEHSIEKGDDEEKETIASSLILGIGIDKEFSRTSGKAFINENVHENWNIAYNQNKIARTSISSMELSCSFVKYAPLFPLDYVGFSWLRAKDKAPIVTVGGDWLISKVTLTIQNSLFSEVVILSREGLMDIGQEK